MKTPVKLTMGIVIAILAVAVAFQSASQNVASQETRPGSLIIYRWNGVEELPERDTIATKTIKSKSIKKTNKTL